MTLKIVSSNESNLESHLGGHMNKTHTDRGSLQYLHQKYGIRSMLDIGCGPGGQVDLAISMGISAVGIDGDYTLKPDIPFILHDFSKAPFVPEDIFDLGWCVEFLEHVEEEFIPNYFATFDKCRYIAATHAVPGQDGHHHVNCQTTDYWMEIFNSFGFEYLPQETLDLKQHSTMIKPFIKRTGMLFRNENYVDNA